MRDPTVRDPTVYENDLYWIIFTIFSSFLYPMLTFVVSAFDHLAVSIVTADPRPMIVF